MNVLVACEESQRVCIAFRARGHNAFSCDIEPCSGGAFVKRRTGEIEKQNISWYCKSYG